MKEKTLTYSGVIIIVLLLITATIALITNARNKLNFNNEKLLNESVTTEKIQVSQELDKVRTYLSVLTTAKESDEKELADTKSRLTETEKRIAYLTNENNSLMKDKNELVQLKKSESELDRAYEDLKLKQETASARIRELENSAIVLDAEKKELTGKLANAEMYRTDNVEIYGSKGNKKDKLTFKAIRTKKINLNFDVPQSLVETITFRIVTPDGKTITPENKSLSWLSVPESENMTASLSPVTGVLNSLKRITLTYSPNEKLEPGEYNIQIFSNDKNIGNCRLKLI